MDDSSDDAYLWVTVDADASPRQIVVSGELDAASASELVGGLRSIEDLSPGVDVDLAQVTFVDSSGLRSIIEAFRTAQAAGYAFRVTATSEAVQRVFDLTGTGELLAP